MIKVQVYISIDPCTAEVLLGPVIKKYIYFFNRNLSQVNCWDKYSLQAYLVIISLFIYTATKMYLKSIHTLY